MGLFDLFGKKKKEEEPKAEYVGNVINQTLDDMSYIMEIRHIKGAWHQYDILLAAKRYGWEYMVDSADYMALVDLKNIGTITITPSLGAEAEECVEEYQKNGGSVRNALSLKPEGSMLGIGGFSKTLGGPVKIVWVNQTCMLRIFVLFEDERRINRYAETVIRRSFGTPDAMKAAKPYVRGE